MVIQGPLDSVDVVAPRSEDPKVVIRVINFELVQPTGWPTNGTIFLNALHWSQQNKKCIDRLFHGLIVRQAVLASSVLDFWSPEPGVATPTEQNRTEVYLTHLQLVELNS